MCQCAKWSDRAETFIQLRSIVSRVQAKPSYILRMSLRHSMCVAIGSLTATRGCSDACATGEWESSSEAGSLLKEKRRNGASTCVAQCRYSMKLQYTCVFPFIGWHSDQPALPINTSELLAFAY